MRHEAIRRTHPSVVTLNGDTPETTIALDAEGNAVAIDEALVSSELAAIQEEQAAGALQRQIDAECQKEGIANEIMLEGLLAGMFALGLLNGKSMQQLGEENAAFKKGLALRALFAQWRAQAQS